MHPDKTHRDTDIFAQMSCSFMDSILLAQVKLSSLPYSKAAIMYTTDHRVINNSSIICGIEHRICT